MDTSEHSINVVAMKCCVAVSGELLDRGFVISGLTTGEIRPSKREQHQSTQHYETHCFLPVPSTAVGSRTGAVPVGVT